MIHFHLFFMSVSSCGSSSSISRKKRGLSADVVVFVIMADCCCCCCCYCYYPQMTNWQFSSTLFVVTPFFSQSSSQRYRLSTQPHNTITANNPLHSTIQIHKTHTYTVIRTSSYFMYLGVLFRFVCIFLQEKEGYVVQPSSVCSFVSWVFNVLFWFIILVHLLLGLVVVVVPMLNFTTLI